MVSQVPGCQSLNRDQSLFEIRLNLEDGQQASTSLRITIPPSFPQVRPSLAVTRPFVHPWIDEAGNLKFPSLLYWTAGQSTLVAVVVEAVVELQSWTPYRQSNDTNDVPRSNSTTVTRLSNSGVSAAVTTQAKQPPPSRQLQHQQNRDIQPSEPNFEVLHTFSAEKLQRLLIDEEAYRELTRQIATGSQQDNCQRQLKAGNVELAEANLSRESELADLRNQIAMIRSSDWIPAKVAFDAKVARQQAVVDQLGPPALISRLSGEAAELEKQSEALYEEYEQKQVPLDELISRHLALRKQYHMKDTVAKAAMETLL